MSRDVNTYQNTYSVHRRALKRKVTLSVRADLVDMAKERGINMSKLLEEALKEELGVWSPFNGSPAGIRTPVAGSRVPHAWPLHHGAMPDVKLSEVFINLTFFF